MVYKHSLRTFSSGVHELYDLWMMPLGSRSKQCIAQIIFDMDNAGHDKAKKRSNNLPRHLSFLVLYSKSFVVNNFSLHTLSTGVECSIRTQVDGTNRGSWKWIMNVTVDMDNGSESGYG